MGWSHGFENGREIGYGVDAICDHPECKQEIDRGLSYRCGGVTSLHEDYGCGNFFCGKHMYFGRLDQVCFTCYKNEPEEDDESRE